MKDLGPRSRLLLLVVAALLAILGAPTWLTGPVGLVSLAATAELAVRPYAVTATDRLLWAMGALLVTLILAGFVLNVPAAGLSRTSWNLAAGAIGVVVLLRRREYLAASGRIPLPAVTARSTLVGLVLVGLLSMSVVLIVKGARAGDRAAIVSLSLVSIQRDRVVVRISSETTSATYRIVASDRPGKARYVGPLFQVMAGIPLEEAIPASPNSRWQIVLNAPSDPGFSRTLIVDTPP